MNHDAICARLPHAGRMCLLERLESWDADSIICIAISHREVDNPLRHAGRLHAVAGIEYAAQAMALHGNLLSATDTSTAQDGGSAENTGAAIPPAIGYLASVRDLNLYLDDLGAIPEDLHIQARRQSGDASGFIYEFEIKAGARTVLNGRLTARLLAAGEVT